MIALAGLAALLGAGAIVTFVGSRLIERAHPPREHAAPFAAAAPGAKLVIVPGMGHMLHHAAADRIVASIEELISMGERRVAKE
jgi:pimeloyl-ACP methyl ester carboxylesterase